MISDPVLLALIVGIPAFITAGVPILLAGINCLVDRRHRQEDRDERNEVAQQAAEAARLLAERQDAAAGKAADAAKLLAVNTAKVAQDATATAAALGGLKEVAQQTHALVNSNLTGQIQANLDSTRRELVLLLHIVDLDREAGRAISKKVTEEISVAEARIAELEITLGERLKSDKENAI